MFMAMCTVFVELDIVSTQEHVLWSLLLLVSSNLCVSVILDLLVIGMIGLQERAVSLLGATEHK